MSGSRILTSDVIHRISRYVSLTLISLVIIECLHPEIQIVSETAQLASLFFIAVIANAVSIHIAVSDGTIDTREHVVSKLRTASLIFLFIAFVISLKPLYESTTVPGFVYTIVFISFGVCCLLTVVYRIPHPRLDEFYDQELLQLRGRSVYQSNIHMMKRNKNTFAGTLLFVAGLGLYHPLIFGLSEVAKIVIFGSFIILISSDEVNK